MVRRNSLYPRRIAPENINAADVIEVEYPETGGVTVIKRGTVAYVQAHAGQRHILTQEGTVIAVWAPGVNTKAKFTILGRIGEPSPMLDMLIESGRL